MKDIKNTIEKHYGKLLEIQKTGDDDKFKIIVMNGSFKEVYYITIHKLASLIIQDEKEYKEKHKKKMEECFKILNK